MRNVLCALVAVGSLFCVEPQRAYGQSAEDLATISVSHGDAEAGDRLYRRNCRACHGATGMGASSYPKLVGQTSEYLVDKIVRYRSGEVFGPNTPLMAQRVKDLTDQDIANVVAYIMSLEEN